MQKTNDDDIYPVSAPDLSMRHFKAIICLTNFKSFLAASAYLRISQPGLTRIIQQAEQRLGFILFERGAKSVSLTAVGKEFLPFAETTLREFARQTNKLRLNHYEERPTLNISCLMSVSHVILPSVIKEFKKYYPNTLIEIYEGVGGLISDAVIDGRVDFGIGSSEFYPKAVSVVDEVEENFVAVMPKRHNLAKLSAITLQNIGHLPLVSMPPSSGIRQLIDAEALKIGLILNHEITTNQYNTMFNFILAGLGVSIVPVSVVRELDKSQFCVQAIEPVINRKLAVLIRSDQILGDSTKQFLKLLLPNLKNIS